MSHIRNNVKICISISAPTSVEMLEKVARALGEGDMIEIRLDSLGENQILPTLDRLPSDGEFLLTLRSVGQGGQCGLDPAGRAAFWRQIAGRYGTERFVADLEIGNDDESAWAGQRVISYHTFEDSPPDLKSIGGRLSERPSAAIHKFAVQTNRISDTLEVWKLLNRGGSDIIPIAMGEAGKWTRILGPAHGAPIAFASLADGLETAPGQISAGDLSRVYGVKSHDRETRVFGLIGDPVSHSLSPYLHNAAFEAAGLNAVFVPFTVEDIDEFFVRFVNAASREVELNFGGFAVTMPHKQSVIRYLDHIDETAKRIGAVNTIVIENGRLKGFNTDAHGFITTLLTRVASVRDVPVAVLGTGGGARACVSALTDAGARVTVFGRDPDSLASLARDFQAQTQTITDFSDFADRDFEIIVNATPLGMIGKLPDATPLTRQQLAGVKLVYDLVTRGDDTPLMREAKEAGAEAIGGLEMLIAQGARQFKLWTGLDPNLEVMRAAAGARLSAKDNHHGD